MELRDIYNLLEANLDKCIDYAPDNMNKQKRIRLPIPEEYGGGVATGYNLEETVKNLISRVKKQIKMEGEGPLFKECWEGWIGLKSGQNRAESTITNYKWVADTYLIPFFREKRIGEITSDDIQGYFNSIIGKSESLSTQSKAILSGIFDRAMRQGYIERNPMSFKYERSRKKGEKVVLQDDELVDVIGKLDLLKDSEDIRDYLYFCFLCFTALRRGEILGLRWSDIDFEDNKIYVRNNVTYPGGQNEPVTHCPKDESFGVVHLQAELAERIKPFVRPGKKYVLPYSFDEQLKPMTRSMFNKLWNRIGKVVDLKGATSHSFRASYVTMMNAHCDHVDPKVLQSALRHKTPDLAIKVYTKENKRKTKIAEEEYDNWLRSQLACSSLRSPGT